MAWQNTQLLVKLALDLSKYVSGMRAAGSEGEKAMGTVSTAGAKAATAQKDLGQQTEQVAKKLKAFRDNTVSSSEAQKDWAKWVDKTRNEQEKLAKSLREVEEAGRAAGKSQREIADVQDRLRTKVDESSSGLMNLATRAGVAFGAIVTGTAAMVMSTANAARELEKLSSLAGTDVVQFQQMAYATRTVGIEKEKLADILKDVNDKVGEFLQTGGGPMKDFFDNVAPRVGVTAEQFSRLGGADALQLYVKSLQAANLSQAEMTFYLEALANDSTLLLPLLADNGAALRTLADEGERLGVVLDARTIEANKRFAESVDTLQQGLVGVRNTIGSSLIPVLQDLVDEFNAGTQSAGGFWKALTTLGTLNPFRSNAENAKVLRSELERLERSRASFLSSGYNTEGLDSDIENVKVKLDYLGKLQRQAVQYSKDDQSAAESARLGITAAAEAGRAATRAAQEQAKAQQELDRINKASLGPLQKKTAELKAIAEWGKKAGWSDEKIAALQDQVAAKYEKSISALNKMSAAEREAKREQEARAELMARLSGVNTDYVQQLGRLQAIRDAGLVSEERYVEMMEELISVQPKASEQIREATKAREALVQAQERSLKTVEDQVQKLKDEEAALAIAAVKNISLAEALEEVAIARLNEAKAKEIAKGKDADQAVIAAIEKEIAARRELATLTGKKEAREAAKKAAEEAAKAWEKTVDQISEGLTDALMRGFEGGKDFGQNFVDSLKNMFKTQIARSLQQSIAQGLAGMLGGGGGSGWASMIGGGQNGGINWSQIASRAYSYFSGGSAASVASTYGTTVGSQQTAMLAAQEAGMGSAAAGAGGVSAMTYAGWIGVAIAAADHLYSKGWDQRALGAVYDRQMVGNFSRTTGVSTGASGIGQGISGAGNGFINPIVQDANNAYKVFDKLGMNDKWASILSGTSFAAHTFGRKLKEFGYKVDVAGDRIEVAGYEFHKGGMLRGDKWKSFDIDDRDAQAVRQQVEDVRDASAAMARALGYSDEAIESFTGSLRINLKGAETAEEKAERYNEALTDLNRQMVNAATGADYTSEQFKTMMDGIGQSMADAGISAEGIADILVDGIMGRMSASEVGAALSDMIVGGIYESIASSYAGQIASVFTGQILTPMFAAMAAGVPVSQAISQQAIQNVVATAQSAAAALNAIFNDAGFRSAIAGIETAISGVAGAVSKVKVPSFGSARLAATNTAAQKRNEIERERYQLETQLAQALGLTALLRQRELASLDASNRHLQQRLWALEDAKSGIDAAMEALERAMDARREALETQLDTARTLESELNDVFQVLKDGIRDLRGEVESTSRMSADAGRALVQRALGGEKVDSDDLADAIDSVRSYIEQTNYASRFERDKAALSFAADLDRLGSITERELSEAERQVLLLEEQLAGLDAQLEAQQQAVDALYGIDTSVKSVGQAVAALSSAMLDFKAASLRERDALGVDTGFSAAGYWSSNADLRSYYEANQSALDAQFGGRDKWLFEHYLTHGLREGRTTGAEGFDADAYYQKYADLQQFYAANKAAIDGTFGTRDEWLLNHWLTLGISEGRKFAKGAAFTNGIVTRPTLFDIGQMGEAGKEAIMPLSNIGGSLGVRAITGGDAETKAILRKVLASLDELNRTQDAGLVYASRTTAILRKAQRPGGALAVQTPEDQPLAVEIVS